MNACVLNNPFIRFYRNEPKAIHRNTSRWTCEPIHLNRKESLKIFHAMSWNILGIFVFHVANFKWCGKYTMTWHGILCHVSYIFLGSNNGLLTLNMDLANRTFDYSLMWGFENKRRQKHAFHHPWCNQYSKCLKLLEKNIKISKLLKWVEIAWLKNIWWN